MKITTLISELQQMVEAHGEDLSMVLQGPINGTTKHESFFFVEEPKTDHASDGMEVVLRLWPY